MARDLSYTVWKASIAPSLSFFFGKNFIIILLPIHFVPSLTIQEVQESKERLLNRITLTKVLLNVTYDIRVTANFKKVALFLL